MMNNTTTATSSVSSNSSTTATPTTATTSPSSSPARKRKTKSIILPSLLPHSTTEDSSSTAQPLRIRTSNPSDTDQPTTSSRQRSNANASNNTPNVISTPTRRQFRISATFGGSGSVSGGSGSSLLTSSTPSSTASPLSPLSESTMTTPAPTTFFSPSFTFPPSPLPTVPHSASTTKSTSIPSPLPKATATIPEETEEQTTSMDLVSDDVAMPTIDAIPSPLKSSTFGSFYVLPSPPAPPTPTLSSGPLDSPLFPDHQYQYHHPLDSPMVLSSIPPPDTIMEEEGEEEQHNMMPQPRPRQSINTAILNRPRARYTFGYDEPLISTLPPRPPSNPSSPISPTSPPPTSSTSTSTAVTSMTAASSPKTILSTLNSEKQRKWHNNNNNKDVVSTLPLSSAVHSPRLRSTSNTTTASVASSSSATAPTSSKRPTTPSQASDHYYRPSKCVDPGLDHSQHHYHHQQQQQQLQKPHLHPSVSTPSLSSPPRAPPQRTSSLTKRSSLLVKKRLSFLANLLSPIPSSSSPPSSSAPPIYSVNKPLPATPQHLVHHQHHHNPLSSPSVNSLLSPYQLQPQPYPTVIARPQEGTINNNLPSYAASTNWLDDLEVKSTSPRKQWSNASMRALYDHDREYNQGDQDSSYQSSFHHGGGGDSGHYVGHSYGHNRSQSQHSHHSQHSHQSHHSHVYGSSSSAFPYSKSHESLGIQALPSAAVGGGISSITAAARSRLDLTIVLVPDDNYTPPRKDVGHHVMKNSKINDIHDDDQIAPVRKGKKRCASLSIFRCFRKK